MLGHDGCEAWFGESFLGVAAGLLLHEEVIGAEVFVGHPHDVVFREGFGAAELFAIVGPGFAL